MQRKSGTLTLDRKGETVRVRFVEGRVVGAENVVLAVGGPGGLYKTSVYPTVHTGGIGLGLMVGAAGVAG